MKRHFNFMLTVAFLLAIATLALAQHNPLKDPNICGRPTCKGGSKFKYGPGSRQDYKYSVDVRSLFNGTSKNESSLFVEAQVSLNFLSPCDGLLTLSEITLSDSRIQDSETEDTPDFQENNSKLFGEAISEYTLRFAFNDGIIYEVCPSEEEKNWVLNFKKGILSMLHNTMKRFDLDHSTEEEDVRGKCNTDYKVIGAKETSLIIEKTKDLTSCQSRSKLHSMVQSAPYNFQSKLTQNQNLLKSFSRCELSIDHNIYNGIKCEERHILQPFSNQDAGASTIIKQRLILVDESKETVDEQPEITKRTSLLFDHVPSPKPKQNELKTARDLIKKMCRLSSDEVQLEFSELFTKSIHTLRILSYQALNALYEHASIACPTGKKHLLDALPYVGSGAAVTLMKNIILANKVSESTVNEWFLIMGFISRPDEDMMKPASELLLKYEFSSTLALTVAALTHTYCKQNTNCHYNEAIYDIIQYLENRVKHYYSLPKLNRLEQDNLMVSLKALANIGVVSDEFKPELGRMIQDSTLEVSLRVAAVELHRRLPCEDTRSFFERIFRDQDQDSEVRIASYLQIMRCPNYVMIRTIRHSLQVEEVNQVGSFIWSHLNNLLKSSIPSRVEIQGLLSEKDLVKKFSGDIRKFSRNSEGSLFFEEYNVGANYESNLIFSTSSYVPRSAMLNFTVDIFGESVNLFEVYGRAEGLEHYIESIFGPKGTLSSMKLQDKIPKMRWARSILENEVLKSEIDELPNFIENSFGKPKVALGLKVFGNELKYATFDGDEEIKAALRTLNPVDHLMRILSGKEISFNKATMFLDSTYVVPSGAGLPLSLNAVGTASINLKLFGSLNVADFSRTKSIDLLADIRPSVSLDVIGTMSVDAFYASSAIKLKTSMYTSSAIEGHIKIRGPKLVSIKFSIPRQTSEIFGARSELLVSRKNVDERQAGLSKHAVAESICSWPAVDKTVGLKLCTDYHFTNVTKIEDAPYFILSGPAGFRVFLQKSDPTAKVYLFEYKWNDGVDLNTISLTFDTPGSTLRRLLSANFTLDKHSQNVTIILQSSAGEFIAKGKYKNTDEEKYLQVALDINDKKHFDTSLSLVRQNSPNGYLYLPKVYLAVNGERVLELKGTLKSMSKNGISQFDIDLKFQTKRLTSQLFGYVSINVASVATNLKLDYTFSGFKEQRVMFEFSAADRSPRNLIHYLGSCKFSTSAYPNFNFDSVLKFQKGNGHTEIKFNLTSLPVPVEHPDAEKHKLQFQWMASDKIFPDSKRIFNTIMSINRQSTGLNLRGQITYETSGADIHIAALGRYAAGKEVSVTIFWSRPRQTLEHMECRINITVPSFTPMILQAKLHEKVASYYIVDVGATWFSGDSISVKGSYFNKCNPRATNHILKLLLKSISFDDISTEIQFYRDNDKLTIDLKASQNNNDYRIFFDHKSLSPEHLATQAKIIYKKQVYSLNSAAHLGDNRKIEVELHLDQIRDIHFNIHGYNMEDRKDVHFNIKWDANRDPNQKLMFSVNFKKLAYLNYEGNLMLSYPGRTVQGFSTFKLEPGYINTLARISWSDEHSFAISLKSNYRNDHGTVFTLESQIITPFEEWKRTKINAGYNHYSNMYHLNGSIFWQQDKQIVLELFEDYSSIDSSFSCELRGCLVSTFKNIPTLNGTVKHSHNNSNIDTILRLRYDPQSVIDLKSNWKLNRGKDSVNITGTVISTTPFTGFSKGVLLSKVYVTNTKYIRGVADLDFDHKKTTVSIEGRLQKITNSMLVINMTTPIENYKKINGRFGFSEEKKHFVSEILYPTGVLGTEVLLSVNSIVNFDVKFSLSTPIKFVPRILIVGKLKSDQADFRVGWNELLAGFTGVWHYVNVIDFEYLYKIYTPIDGFKENGIVAKLIYKEGLDFEVAIKLSERKLGLKVLGSKNPNILNELGLNPQEIYKGKLTKKAYSSESEEEYDEDGSDSNSNEALNWSGLIEIDTIMYPTMKGSVDLEQTGALYVLIAKLTLPDGQAELTDEFEYINILAMRNDLKLKTPYVLFKEVESNFNFEITPSQYYNLGLSLDYLNNTKWIKMGAEIQYKLRNGTATAEVTHNISIHAHTPFVVLPRLDVEAVLETHLNIYRTDLSVTTNNSDISATASAEVDGNFLNAQLTGKVVTPNFVIPQTYLSYLRDLTPTNNLIEMHCKIPDLIPKEIFFKSNWYYESLRNFNGFVEYTSPFKGLENLLGAIKFVYANGQATSHAVLKMHPVEFESNTTLTNNNIKGSTNLQLNSNKYPVTIDCNIIRKSKSNLEFKGNVYMKQSLMYLNGKVYLHENIPIKGEITLTPADHGPPLLLAYTVSIQDTEYRLIGNISHSDKWTRIDAQADIKSTLQWNVNAELNTSHKLYNKFGIHASSISTKSSTSLSLEAETPFPKLERPKMGASLKTMSPRNLLEAYIDFEEVKANAQASYIFVLLENMDVKYSGSMTSKSTSSNTQVSVRYVNPGKKFNYLDLGADVDLDQKWTAGSNITINLPSKQDIQINGLVKLPPPYNQIHEVLGKLNYTNQFKWAEFIAKYSRDKPSVSYGASGTLNLSNQKNLGGNLEVDWNNKIYGNEIHLGQSKGDYHALYKLRTPKFRNEKTFVTEIDYKSSGPHDSLVLDIFYPESKPMAAAKVDFQEIANMNGTIKVRVPYRNLSYVTADFETETNTYVYNRFLGVSWANNSAVFDSKCSFKTGKSLFDKDTDGVLHLEIPLTTRHIAELKYHYERRHQQSKGRATVDYNSNKVLEGHYNCLSESRAGFDKDMIHVELQNEWVPVGANYVHGYEYGVPRDGSNAPTVDSKNIHVYHLKNRTLDVKGDMQVKTSSSGQQIALTATHSNRTVKFETSYDVLDQQLKQHSRLQLSPSIWIAYDLELLNKTADETFDAQSVQINVSYPRRNFTAEGSYNISESSVSTDVSLLWDKDRKTVQAALDWDRQGPNREQIQLQIKHPSFQRDVVILGEYEKGEKKLFDTKVTINYSIDPEQTFKFCSKVEDRSNTNMYRYTYKVWAVHNATNLNLNTRGDVFWNSNGFTGNHYNAYKRSYLPLQITDALARLDLVRNMIEIKKNSTRELYYLSGIVGGEYPVYTANLTKIENMNAVNGEFYTNIKEKLIQLEMNLTTDGTQSLHMYGNIPDARSAIFDVWRDYEDIRISDVAYYLRLNHSRLIVSRLYWRPDLLLDIQSTVRATAKQNYDSFLRNINETKQYIRSETNEAVHGIWQDAKPVLGNFLDDLKSLKVIETDIDDFKIFLNNSYNNNEFFMKNITNMVLYLCDELALKSKLQSLPAIVSELLEIMGESGQKIQKSIRWVIEMIKTYYKNTSEFIKRLFEGDPVEYLSEALKDIVEKYDNFIKEMHVAFIQYVERLWQQTYMLIVDHWHKTLASIEPTMLKIVHYLETILWNTSREFLDFLYIHKNEIIESPYFVRFANFSQDLDKFYKEITGKNPLRAVYKYIKITWNFFKEKYLNKIPFSKELQDIFDEIVEEISELKKLPSLKYIIDKYNEFSENAKWFCDYFDVENRLHRFLTLIHLKMTDMSQTALETENRNRVAKTKFIFDPYEGIMYLEQKLPMSWHSFNETPKFQEIPEIKYLYNLQSYFTFTHTSFWNFYYDYKPYTDPSEWFPPFSAQAIIAGPNYYITFDRKYYDFRGKCSYLLATDALDKNFTIIASYDDKARTNELILLINGTVLSINVFTDVVKIGNNHEENLPVEFSETYVYRDADIVTVKSKLGFVLECNMKFDICLFQVSGWYFGKTAGLWGTLNNEPSDDLLTSDKKRANMSEVVDFANSWALNKQCVKSTQNHKEIAALQRQPDKQIVSLCEDFFLSKVSQFTTCFPRVPSAPFLSMCLNSTTIEETCTFAIAYLNLCAYANTPLRIPDSCVKCSLPNGTTIPEGEIMRLQDDSVPNSADVVFIVEAKECNNNLKSTKHIDTVVELLSKELNDVNVTNNRYSLVVFGGSGVYNEPRSISVNSQVFTDPQRFISYWDHIKIGNGNSDLFNAIIFATKLIFRPAVSKTFILIPCSECADKNMKFDYAILHQLLVDNDVTLHILMNDTFTVTKSKENKVAFGIDRNLAYTKKDIRVLKGDSILKKQIKVPKSTLGFCTSLALETNGTIFSSKFLKTDKKNSKRFGTVFAKRVASSAIPKSCVTCECTGTNSGVSYMECYPCFYPTGGNLDYMGFDTDDAISFLQPDDALYER